MTAPLVEVVEHRREDRSGRYDIGGTVAYLCGVYVSVDRLACGHTVEVEGGGKAMRAVRRGLVVSGDAMVPSDRLAAYLRQTGAKEPTARQRQRIRHKNNHLMALEARKAKGRLRRRR